MRVLFLPDFGDSNPYQRLLADSLRAEGIEVRSARAYERRWLPLIHAVRTGPRPDVLHLHWTHPYIDRPGGGDRVSRLLALRLLVELRLVRALGIRVVWTVHNITKHERPDPRPELAVSRRIVGLAHAVIAHCEAAVATALDAYDVARHAAKFHVARHGSYLGVYPSDISRPDARARLGLPDEGRVYAFVGQVRPYKGVPELISAFRSLDDPSARLVIAGKPKTGADAERLRALAAGDTRIRLELRYVADDELQLFLCAADAVVFPFQDILTSSTVVLAMSFGRPVIAPRRGCVDETLDDAGSLLYDGTDPRGLADALGRAQTADLDAMGAHNASLAAALDWRETARDTIRAYGG